VPGAKKVRILASLRYGWRLTRKHFRTLVPGSILFYSPDLAKMLGWQAEASAWGWFITAWHSAWACGLLWHALQLSDQETRSSRLHKATLPAPGYLRRFIASTGLYWSILLLGLWPALRLASGQWWPADRSAALAWLARPWTWDWTQMRLAIEVLLVALPTGVWTVYGWFHGYYVADEGQDAWPSMLSSLRAVRGAFFKTLAFVVVIGLVNYAGYSLWVVGVFLAFPVTLMATTFVHLELKLQTVGKPKGGKRR
jgi:hypothetical protein